ncbi:MAG TPA: MEDS domain-containing protein [Streptosporangiaceae bacterium]|nr:MEDS domain-containing protein [Streptosporangiaceae bacterium]
MEYGAADQANGTPAGWGKPSGRVNVLAPARAAGWALAFGAWARGHWQDPLPRSAWRERTPPGGQRTGPGSRSPTGKDRLINGDNRASGERFGRPPGDVSALVSGQHLCALYQNQDERRRLTAAVIRGALAAGDRVIYVTPGPSDVALALLEAGGIETGRPVRGGQLLVHSFGEIYGDLASTDLAQLVATFRAALSQSLAAGFPGLRITGEMGGCSWPAGSLEGLVRWERMVSQMLGEVGIAAICQYDQRQLDEPATTVIAAEHSGVATNGQRLPLALFIASTPPPALRVEGELDLTNGPVLARVIRARLAASPRLRVDLGGVAFADVGSLREIYQIAVGLPAGSRITLANVTEPVRRVLDLAGFRADAVVIDS